MSTLPDVRPIAPEDVKDDKKFKNVVTNTLNRFMESVYSGFNNDITFEDNIRSEKRQFTLTEGADVGGGNTFKFSTSIDNPFACQLTKIIQQGGSHVNLSSVFLDWDFANTEITIYNISGLNSDKIYDINLLIF
jgi:hypothetical protein